jgi:uncharacterized membrane protein YedE/YeeE
MRTLMIALASGLLFGFGLGLSGMTQPQKVINFLDISGNWDPSLAFVMGGALFVNAIAYAFSRKTAKPVFALKYELPSKRDIDPRLISGAAIFGIGWGLLGYCPGPGLANLATMHLEPLIFVFTFIISALATRYILSKPAIS